ncbi:Uncharacterised protein [Vibrio cholerae]|nr:Uncharacterised protein [Vibrio cholerae]
MKFPFSELFIKSFITKHSNREQKCQPLSRQIQ